MGPWVMPTDRYVAYLDSDFNPATEADATLVKVVEPDGSVMFLQRPQPLGKALYRPDRARTGLGRWASEAPTGTAGPMTPIRWEHRDYGAVASVLLQVPRYAHGTVTVSVRVAQNAKGVWTVRVQAERYPIAPLKWTGFPTLAAAQDAARQAVEQMHAAILTHRETHGG